MANAGYIIIKDSEKAEKKAEPKPTNFRAFYGPLDKGSAKPSFCYPKQKEELKSEITRRKNNLKKNMVAETRIQKEEYEVGQLESKLDRINEQEDNAKKLFKENKDSVAARYAEIKEQIAARMPTANDVAKRRFNSQRIHDDEKKGLKGAAPLGELKREYQVLSHLLEEDSNTKMLQRD